MVVATEPTPNPAAFKFNVNGPITPEGVSKAFNNEFEAEGDPFAEAMFSFGVVDFLYIQDRFVSVTLTDPEEWELLLDHIIQAIEQHLTPYDGPKKDEEEDSYNILNEVSLADFNTYDDAVKAEIIDAYMDESVRPALARDGGGVIVLGVEGDVVRIRYQGACGSCSKSQSGTLSAIQTILSENVDPNLRVIIGGFEDM